MQPKRRENMLQSKINIFSFIFPSSIKPTQIQQQKLTVFTSSYSFHIWPLPLIIKYEWYEAEMLLIDSLLKQTQLLDTATSTAFGWQSNIDRNTGSPQRYLLVQWQPLATLLQNDRIAKLRPFTHTYISIGPRRIILGPTDLWRWKTVHSFQRLASDYPATQFCIPEERNPQLHC